MRCAVQGCSVNNKKKNFNKQICFHSFPKDNKLCNQWVNLCGRSQQFNKETARICSKHFAPSNYVELNPLLKELGIPVKAKRLKPNVSPSLLLPFRKTDNSLTLRTQRSKKLTSANKTQGYVYVISEFANALPQTATDNEGSASSTLETVDTCTLTEVKVGVLDASSLTSDHSTQTDPITPSYEQLQAEIISLKQKCCNQRQVINSMNKILTKCQSKKM